MLSINKLIFEEAVKLALHHEMIARDSNEHSERLNHIYRVDEIIGYRHQIQGTTTDELTKRMAVFFLEDLMKKDLVQLISEHTKVVAVLTILLLNVSNDRSQ